MSKACPTGKVRYPNRAEAQAQADLMIRLDTKREMPHLSVGVNVYQCPQCHLWHFGHRRGSWLESRYLRMHRQEGRDKKGKRR